jgi:hypothetical protein
MMNERKTKLEVEELEERIAPSATGNRQQQSPRTTRIFGNQPKNR